MKINEFLNYFFHINDQIFYILKSFFVTVNDESIIQLKCSCNLKMHSKAIEFGRSWGTIDCAYATVLHCAPKYE